ncbi:hypothetical protein CspHIS471_0500810 [Cutaneotrichosporon sp. HIS471]|nr:hypothetical protein CspHIS471_0500810 [Cutaneotrichosporon sp. HIS471]
MDGYDALDAATSSYTKHRDDRASHRDDRDRDRRHRDRDYDRDRSDRRPHDHDPYGREGGRDRDPYERRNRDRDYDRRDRDQGRDRDPYGRRDERGWSPPRRRDDRAGYGREPPRDGGRGGGPRGGGGRRRDSPARSPTPTDAIPLEDRVVEPSLWDLAPPEFQGISALEAKMTGMFTYGPGRVAPPMHLGQLAAGLINPLRQNKRVYQADIPDTVSEKQLMRFWNRLMTDRNKASVPGECVNQVQVNREKKFAWVEFRNANEATAALELNGTEFEGAPMELKRPKDYIGIDPALGFLGPATEGNNKLFVGGLPTNLGNEQVMELLKSFGELRTFNLVKEGNGSVSKGFAFVEYLDPAVTDMAIQGLNGFQIGERALVVQRAATTNRATGGAQEHGAAAFLATSKILEEADAEPADTRVMLMLNMVTEDELYDDQEYEDILLDVKEECEKYGVVEGVRIPRPVPKSTKWETSDSAAQTAEKNRRINEEAGVGRVYVMYTDIPGCQKAMKSLGGRQFGGRTILVASTSEEDFMGPAPPPPPSEPPMQLEAPPPPPVAAVPAPPAPPAAPEDMDQTAGNLLAELGV